MVVEGTIEDLDTIAREVLVRVKDEILGLDVPVTCPVYVNEQRVKMRLLQPFDNVVVDFKREGDRAVAESIVVGRNSADPSGYR